MTRTLSVFTLAVVIGATTVNLSAQMVHVDVKDAAGKSVGMIMFSPAKAGGVTVEVDLTGLPPGEHALHVHAVPKCEAPFTSAGPHFNPANKKHGPQNPEGPHAGDLGNITVNAKGVARTKLTAAGLTMGSEANSIYANGGTAVVIHAAADDLKSDPGGNAGDRIACGVITK